MRNGGACLTLSVKAPTWPVCDNRPNNKKVALELHHRTLLQAKTIDVPPAEHIDWVGAGGMQIHGLHFAPVSPPANGELPATVMCAKYGLSSNVMARITRDAFSPSPHRSKSRVHTEHSRKAGPFSVARLKMDLPFQNRRAYTRVQRRSASSLCAARNVDKENALLSAAIRLPRPSRSTAPNHTQPHSTTHSSVIPNRTQTTLICCPQPILHRCPRPRQVRPRRANRCPGGPVLPGVPGRPGLDCAAAGVHTSTRLATALR